MNRILSLTGVAITFAYLAFVWWLFGSRWDEIRALPPNSIGDLLAGAFGPLTIVWLVLGFFQQGVELRQNTKALELQAQELKNSVDQQRELARVSNEQLSAQREALRDEREKSVVAASPRFIFVCKGHTSSAPIARHHFAIVNTGAPAAKVALRTSDRIVELSLNEVTVFEPYGERTMDVMFLDRKPRSGVTLALTCVNAMGVGFAWTYVLVVDQSGYVREIIPNAA